MTKEELTKLEAVLVACEFAHTVDDSGCPTCGYDTRKTCPLCDAEKDSGKKGSRHYKGCALWASLQTVRKSLAGSGRYDPRIDAPYDSD